MELEHLLLATIQNLLVLAVVVSVIGFTIMIIEEYSYWKYRERRYEEWLKNINDRSRNERE